MIMISMVIDQHDYLDHLDHHDQYDLGTLSEKNYEIIWEFFPYRGGFPNPKTFVN